MLPSTPDGPVPHEPRVALRVVGIGASAGGLETCSELLRHLPADTGLAYVYVQHLAPEHASNLTELLGRVSRIPVRTVVDGLALQPDCLYVAPPDRDAVLDGRHLRLVPRSRDKGRHLPIDRLLESMAQQLGPRAMGVILTGTGADGAQGLRAIAAEGGVTLVQEPASARYDGMPHAALSAVPASFCGDPAALAGELARLAQGGPPAAGEEAPEAAPSPDDAEEAALGAILQTVRAATGVDFAHYKRSTIRRRIARRMLLHRVEKLKAYRQVLDRVPGEPQALFEEMLINVTSFFRDPEVFDTLAREVFPHLPLGRHAGGAEAIRVWVPGCSTGEEAYSLAIALLEF